MVNNEIEKEEIDTLGSELSESLKNAREILVVNNVKERGFVDKRLKIIGFIMMLLSVSSAFAWAALNASWWVPIDGIEQSLRGFALIVFHIVVFLYGMNFQCRDEGK